MKTKNKDFYRCPFDNSKLLLVDEEIKGSDVVQGKLVSENNNEYTINNGIPDFTWPKELSELDEHERKIYEELAKEYDKFASIPFNTFKSNEYDVRENIAERLNINENSKVLEIGCGDGRGAEHIAKRLGSSGEFYLQELSPSFMRNAIKRLAKYEDKIDLNFSIASAMHLSFPDNYFDAAHHFGGLSTFSDVERCLKEMVRVVRPGGKIVVGDESMGLWLRETEFGKIMMNSNPLLKYEIPFSDLPKEVRNVKVEWIMMGAYFVLEFEVGEGEPVANYHVPIPSKRGGNHWIRYYGNLEGVKDETKELAHKAIQKNGKSMHDWLDELVKQAALKELED
ncbi:MAG: class I SAM-dependent methyltransferase [Vicingus serpentipes]|nr:class I SAM-dependent methyltransferase [Vicingus serpentipes]